MKSLDAYWYSQNPVAWILWPVSCVYRALVFVRRWLYKSGLKKSHSISVPLIVVGNISVGGTGKTPLLIALCNLLKKQGFKPGIVSRGYGGHYTGVQLVDSNDTPERVGDEPYLINQRTHCPVVVGKDRVAAANFLLKHHSCDLLLSDDGLQHYRMRRDLEIAVVDIKRKFGNGFFLPSGPLREPVSRLKDVDILVYHGQTTCDNNFVLEFSDAINLHTGETRSIQSFKGFTVHAIAGIGYPDRFFDQLEQFDLTIVRHPFPDHHIYKASDISFSLEDAECDTKSAVLMTEKDAVKCTGFSTENVWYVPVNANLSGHLIDSFMKKIRPDSA